MLPMRSTHSSCLRRISASNSSPWRPTDKISSWKMHEYRVFLILYWLHFYLTFSLLYSSLCTIKSCSVDSTELGNSVSCICRINASKWWATSVVCAEKFSSDCKKKYNAFIIELNWRSCELEELSHFFYRRRSIQSSLECKLILFLISCALAGFEGNFCKKCSIEPLRNPCMHQEFIWKASGKKLTSNTQPCHLNRKMLYTHNSLLYPFMMGIKQITAEIHC